MALQIRRGTDTQRQALSGPNTPIAGELLYSTDNKKLYIGDGTTTGGTSIGYFGSVAVSGQSTIRSTGTNEALTIVAGANISLVTDANTGVLTIAAAPQELNNGNLRLFQNNISSINSNEDINIDPAGTGKVNVVGNLTANSLTGPLTGNVTGNAGTVTNGVYTTDTGTVTNTMLAGSIDNNKLVNNSLTIGSTNVSLGSTSTTLSGLSSVTSESATVGNISISQNNIRTATSNSNLVFDTSGTGRIELRKPTEGSRLELYTDFVGSGLFIANNSATNAGFVLINSHDTVSLSPTYVPAPLGSSQVGAPATYGRSRGNALFPSAVSNNDELMVFDFLGYTDATNKLKSAAKLKIIADSSPSAGNIAGRFEFVTTSSTGAQAVRFTVSSTAVTSTVPISNGSLQLFQNNLAGLNSNEDIVIDPSGTGKLQVLGNLAITGTLTFPDSTVQTTAYQKVAVPAHSYGIVGDTQGMLAFDATYIYYCTANYVNTSTNIWKRTAHGAGTW